MRGVIMTEGKLIRPRIVRLTLGVVFIGLSVAVFIRGGNVDVVSAFVFSMTGFIVGDIVRTR
jgi:uncharacterized membrane protein YjjP (DUF1212 family)